MYKNDRYVSQENVQIIGAEIKRRRLLMSKTLEKSEYGSISYKSKIENGKIIPKFYILQELCKEYGITEEELDTLITVDEKINACIEAMFWENNNTIAKVYENINGFDNHKVNLIKIMYEMGYYHWDKVNKLLDSMYVIRNNLSETDYFLYLYLLMCNANRNHDYPEVYDLYNKFRNCKNDHIMALAAKEMFVAVCHYGLENPIFAYEEFNKKYKSLLNYSISNMYTLLLETLIRLNYELPESTQKELSPELKLLYLLSKQDVEKIDIFLEENKTSVFEKLLIYTVKRDYAKAEKLYNRLQLNKLTAKEIIIANYCAVLNSGDNDKIADFLINVGLDYAKKTNDGLLFKMFLYKLSDISFFVGRYKTVAAMNLVYFDMVGKCKTCML